MSQEVEHSGPTTLPIHTLISPFVRFAKLEAASGIVLLAGTIAALVWANSPWQHSYDVLWDAQASIGLGSFMLSESRHEWINNGLMSLFFFLVGLEIKREVLIGELSSLRQAAFPFIAAVGGTIVPALMYVAVTYGSRGQRGWGIPMATDIAFALGILALLGNRVPVSIKVFVTALAIVDDIIAVLVVALFYTDQIHLWSLFIGFAGIAFCVAINLLGVSKPAIYAVVGICVWCAVLKSGVHATVAGVLLAFTIPSRTYLDRAFFLRRSRWLLHTFETAPPNSFASHAAIHTLEKQCKLIESPLHRIEHSLQPWVSFLVMPLFAFANSGVRILGNVFSAVKHPVSMGVLLGLFFGKPLGIWLFAWAFSKIGLATSPPELSWTSIFGASWLCGIGFTMSLFIAALAFDDGALLDMAKIGILGASVAAGVCGSLFFLRRPAADVGRISMEGRAS